MQIPKTPEKLALRLALNFSTLEKLLKIKGLGGNRHPRGGSSVDDVNATRSAWGLAIAFLNSSVECFLVNV